MSIYIPHLGSLAFHVFWGIIDFDNIAPTLIKRPARDACLCMGDLQAPPAPAAPPAPHFVFLITL